MKCRKDLPIVLLMLACCGGRSALDLTPPSSSGAGQGGTSNSDPSSGSGSGESTPGSAGRGDASAGIDGTGATCSAQPATGVTIASSGHITAIGVSGSTLYIGGDGTISEVPLGGGTTRSLVAPKGVSGGFAFDASRLYYPWNTVTTTDAGTSLYLSGIVSEDLTTQIALSLPNPQTPDQLAAIAARPGVFWLGGPSIPFGLGTTLYFWDPQSNMNSPLATGEDFQGVAVDDTGVYWADTGGQQDTIFTAPLAGGPSSVLATVPWSEARGAVLGLSSTSVVFLSDAVTGSTGMIEVSIEAVAKTGGSVRHVLTADVAGAWVDDDKIYWTDQADYGRLQRTPIAGGAPEVVWDQQPSAQQAGAPPQVARVAFDACNIYIGVSNASMTFPTPDPAISTTVYVDQVYARGK
jgi:hypothetical protein